MNVVVEEVRFPPISAAVPVAQRSDAFIFVDIRPVEYETIAVFSAEFLKILFRHLAVPFDKNRKESGQPFDFEFG